MDKTGWIGREVTGLISKSGWVSTEGNGIWTASADPSKPTPIFVTASLRNSNSWSHVANLLLNDGWGGF